MGDTKIWLGFYILLENSYLKKYGVLDIAVGPSATPGR
jgi:hypothetical protein